MVCNSWRNLLATFTNTALVKSRLDQFLFVCLVRVMLNFKKCLDELKVSSLKESLHKRLLTVFGN